MASRPEIVEKVLIVGCDNCMIDDCTACYPCISAFNNREGEFSVLKDEKTGEPLPAQLVGLVSCGGCPGTTTIVARLNQAHKWIAGTEKNDLPTKIFVGNCIQGCPNAEEITKKIEDASSVGPIKGTHHKTPASEAAEKTKWWQKASGKPGEKKILFKRK